MHTNGPEVPAYSVIRSALAIASVPDGNSMLRQLHTCAEALESSETLLFTSKEVTVKHCAHLAVALHSCQ